MYYRSKIKETLELAIMDVLVKPVFTVNVLLAATVWLLLSPTVAVTFHVYELLQAVWYFGMCKWLLVRLYIVSLVANWSVWDRFIKLARATSYRKSTGSVWSAETDGGDQDNDTESLRTTLLSEEGAP